MGIRIRDESDSKLELVREICDIYARANACTHWHHPDTKNSPFIDWYLLLHVEENAEIDVIRKQYRKLALQLHPDKNNHPNAEFAFKLISQGFTCLSDNSKRKAFNLERWKSFCNECNRVPYKHLNPHATFNAAKLDRSSSKKILQGLKEIRARFKEEARIIENCVKANKESKKEKLSFNATRKETPVFNPSNYQFQRYPHCRTSNKQKIQSLWSLSTRNVLNFEHRSISPIFEMGPEKSH